MNFGLLFIFFGLLLLIGAAHEECQSGGCNNIVCPSDPLTPDESEEALEESSPPKEFDASELP